MSVGADIAIGVLVLIGLVVLAALRGMINIVQQGQVGVVKRLGEYRRTHEPGLVVIAPFVDSLQDVDMRRRPWFRAAERERRTGLTTPYQSILTGEQCFTACGCMTRPDGSFGGVLAIDVNVTGWTRI